MKAPIEIERKYTTWDCMNCKENNNIQMPFISEITDRKKFTDGRVKCSKCQTEHYVCVNRVEAVRCLI